jgi:uncharacterized protein YndB with AHSA1/START domain
MCLEDSLDGCTGWVVFESNDESLWVGPREANPCLRSASLVAERAIMTPTDVTQAAESTAGDSTGATSGDVYRLGHRWVINGPIDLVFDVLSQSRDYPIWWAPCFKSAESEDTEVVVGARSHLRVRSQLPYELVWDVTVVELDRPNLIVVDTIVRLSGRFPLRGPIRYTLADGPDGVEVINEQVIVSERRVPRPLRALLQRTFAYNHNWAFKIGGRGLQKAVDEAVATRAIAAPVADTPVA